MSRAPNADGAGDESPTPLHMAADAKTDRTADLERLAEEHESLTLLIDRLGGGDVPAADLVAAMRAEWPHLRESYCQRWLVGACMGQRGIATDNDGRTYYATEPAPPLQIVRDMPPPAASRLKSAADRRDRPAPEWTITDTLPAYGVGQLVGPSYTGKTYVGVDLALTLLMTASASGSAGRCTGMARSSMC